MCKKYIKIFIISAFIAFCMPIIACAAPPEDEIEVVEDDYFDSFIQYFKLEGTEFMPKEEEKDESDSMDTLFTDMNKEDNVEIIDQLDELELDEEENDINEFSFLYLNKGFEEKKKTEDDAKVDDSVISVVPTFSATKNISGTGEEGVSIGVIVFDGWTEENKPYNITFKSKYQTIGPSKLFNETIEFNTVGTNYIFIAVMKDDVPEYKIYVLNRKEEDTKKKLENLEIEFIKIDEETEEKKEQDTKEETYSLFEKKDNLLIEDLAEGIPMIELKEAIPMTELTESK